MTGIPPVRGEHLCCLRLLGQQFKLQRYSWNKQNGTRLSHGPKNYSHRGNTLDIIPLVHYEKKPENNPGTCCARNNVCLDRRVSTQQTEPNMGGKTLKIVHGVGKHLSKKRTEHANHFCQTTVHASFPFCLNSDRNLVGCLGWAVVERNYCLARNSGFPLWRIVSVWDQDTDKQPNWESQVCAKRNE